MTEVIEKFAQGGGNLPSRVDKEDLVDFARIILENNYIEFNGDSYRQRMGTVVGTKFAPAYAKIFMARLEGENVE